MPLSAEMREFFDKVARMNFSLACDAYHALATVEEMTSGLRAKVQEVLRLSR